ncbi:MAG: tryptophan 7-halogenase [Pseudomonadota bacterium]|nr:tryptophan 7-halogenase [Pseudomonadota bacterium]
MIPDVLVVGAGPTGCALGTYLARKGVSVTLLEAVERPESVVGESMLPGSGPIFEELGFDTSDFVVKHGAVFCQGGESVRFDFKEAESPKFTSAWQVQREVFDLRWRELALAAGCRIVYGKALGADIPARTLQTTEGAMTAGRIVDAGGRSMWLSSHLGHRVADPRLKNSAIGTRCRGVTALSPEVPGDITICCIDNGWIWIIPFGGGVASVGVVMAPACTLRGTAEERFAAAIASSPDATARLAGAERIFPFRGLTDFTATSTTFHGEGFALCGDAATFIDPVFSSGVLLGLHGARGLAAALLSGGAGDLDAWQAEYRDGAGVFRKVIDHWYAGDFMTLALAPREVQKPYFRRGIVSLLAGDVFRAGPTASRLMADRMPTLAHAVRSSAAGA